MSHPAKTVTQETPIMEVAEKFTQEKINRVPVVDTEGLIVGILSRADVVSSSLLWEPP